MTVDHAREWIHDVPLPCAWAEDVNNFVPAASQLIGNKISVTAPRNSFRAHDRGRQARLEKPIERVLKLGSRHVIRISAKLTIAQGRVERIWQRLAPAAELHDVHVFDARLGE